MQWNAFLNHSHWNILGWKGPTGITDSARQGLGSGLLVPSLPSGLSYRSGHSSSSRCHLCLNPSCTVLACCGPTPLILWILFSLNRSSVRCVIADSCCGYEVMCLVLFFTFVQSRKSFYSFFGERNFKSSFRELETLSFIFPLHSRVVN